MKTTPLRHFAAFGTAAFLILLTLISSAQDPAAYRERYRPQFHFTPAKNWMNDPNGMFYYDSEYHLFYQYNPFGEKWGHMSWGHTVSEDLVHWKHLPLALAEENGVMIFSGSAVVDWKNTSGFGKDGKPPLVAIYTGHYTEKPLQNQQIAYSNDRGRTWTKYEGNPVIDIGYKDFRDPKVFWHEDSTQWVMAVSLPVERTVRFYGSPDLKKWTKLSDFGPAGCVSGIWECPDLFPLPVEGSDQQKWALIVNIGSGAPAGGSGCQYFVGEFDGKTFSLHEPSQPDPEPAFVPEGQVFADFENGYGDWKVEGDAFGTAPATGAIGGQQAVDGFRGKGLVNSFLGGDGSTGQLTSPAFEISHAAISFLIGGGAHDTNTCVNLVAHGKVVRSAEGDASERLAWKSWDVRDLKGKTAHIEIVDRWKKGWGHINIDHVLFSDTPAKPATNPANWADYGRDFYAAVSWSDVPKEDGRRLWIGWMSNWQYAQDVPTSPWRSSMTVARSLSLRRVGDAYRLLQKPVKELASIRRNSQTARVVSIDYAIGMLNEANAELIDIEFAMPASDALEISLMKSGSGRANLLIDPANEKLSFDRRKFGATGFHSSFSEIHEAPLRAIDGMVTVRLILDTSSVEILANGGESVISDKMFPQPGPLRFGFSFKGEGAPPKFSSISVATLKSAW
jgi:sucrose-6-phosphate hydrolase SacC (GH32 family)